MRKILASLVLVFVLFVLSPVNAHAAVFKCFASSVYAYGFGWSSTPQAACAIALRECALRAPIGDVCYARWWVWEQ